TALRGWPRAARGGSGRLVRRRTYCPTLPAAYDAVLRCALADRDSTVDSDTGSCCERIVRAGVFCVLGRRRSVGSPDAVGRKNRCRTRRSGNPYWTGGFRTRVAVCTVSHDAERLVVPLTKRPPRLCPHALAAFPGANARER